MYGTHHRWRVIHFTSDCIYDATPLTVGLLLRHKIIETGNNCGRAVYHSLCLHIHTFRVVFPSRSNNWAVGSCFYDICTEIVPLAALPGLSAWCCVAISCAPCAVACLRRAGERGQTFVVWRNGRSHIRKAGIAKHRSFGDMRLAHKDDVCKKERKIGSTSKKAIVRVRFEILYLRMYWKVLYKMQGSK